MKQLLQKINKNRKKGSLFWQGGASPVDSLRLPILAMPASRGFKCFRCPLQLPLWVLLLARIHTEMGADNKVWSSWPACDDMESPRIKCPSMKEHISDPNKLTVLSVLGDTRGNRHSKQHSTDAILKALPTRLKFSWRRSQDTVHSLWQSWEQGDLQISSLSQSQMLRQNSTSQGTVTWNV